MLKRPQYFGRGCTLVVVGLAIICQALVSGSEHAWVVAIFVGVAILYPGFTMTAMAIWSDGQ